MQLGMSLKADLMVFSKARVTKAVCASRPLPTVLPVARKSLGDNEAKFVICQEVKNVSPTEVE